LRDITVRKHAEQVQREGEERLRKQYEGLPLPTYTWQRTGEDFVLVAYNRAAEEISRGRIAHSVGEKASEVYAELPALRQDLARCLVEKTMLTSDVACRASGRLARSSRLTNGRFRLSEPRWRLRPRGSTRCDRTQRQPHLPPTPAGPDQANSLRHASAPRRQ